jgi:acetyl esterase/lipase
MKGLPQALVFIGKADVLASEDFEYARRLERDLVPVSVMAVRGSHACLGFDANIGKVVDRMKEMLA